MFTDHVYSAQLSLHALMRGNDRMVHLLLLGAMLVKVLLVSYHYLVRNSND